MSFIHGLMPAQLDPILAPQNNVIGGDEGMFVAKKDLLGIQTLQDRLGGRSFLVHCKFSPARLVVMCMRGSTPGFYF